MPTMTMTTTMIMTTIEFVPVISLQATLQVTLLRSHQYITPSPLPPAVVHRDSFITPLHSWGTIRYYGDYATSAIQHNTSH